MKISPKVIINAIRQNKLLTNKYLVALMVFFIWIMFFDENNLVSHHRNKQQLKTLKEQRTFYREKIESDRKKLEELRSGTGNLEKYAREEFHMTRPDEDLYLVVEK